MADNVIQTELWETRSEDVPTIVQPDCRCIGKIGEYLAAAELEIAGYACSFASEGLPYDLIVDTDAGVRKVQVKATRRPLTHGTTTAYSFSGGSDGGHFAKYKGAIDVFAFVALDLRRVMFMREEDVKGSSNYRLAPKHFANADRLEKSLRSSLR